MNRQVPPPLVERVVEADERHIEFTWSAAAVLPDLLVALGSSGYLLAQATRFRRAYSDEARAEALAALASDHRVREALVFRLDPEHAECLEASLQILNVEPERCRRDGCNSYEEPGTGLCAAHFEVADVAVRL